MHTRSNFIGRKKRGERKKKKKEGNGFGTFLIARTIFIIFLCSHFEGTNLRKIIMIILNKVLFFIIFSFIFF